MGAITHRLVDRAIAHGALLQNPCLTNVEVTD